MSKQTEPLALFCRMEGEGREEKERRDWAWFVRKKGKEKESSCGSFVKLFLLSHLYYNVKSKLF
jgi:hypothetical protein